jgi:uncharacterized protein (TIGR03437 family)
MLISSNAAFSSKLLSNGTRSDLSWTDSLLLVDDPSAEAQTACVAPSSLTCPRAAGETGPNVFQGRQLQDNLLVFSNVSIDAPGPDGTRLLRVTNVRANLAQLVAREKVDEVRLSVQMLVNGKSIPIENNDVVVARGLPSFKFAVRTALDGEVSDKDPVFTVTPTMVPEKAAPTQGPLLNVKFTEQFPSAFRRRNLATNAADPGFVASQARPGVEYATETGFFNNALVTATNLERAGLADSGTRLRVTLKDIPRNVTLWASVRDVAAGTSGYSLTNPKAILIHADENGSGPLSIAKATAPGFFQVPVSEGRATILWEVTSSDSELLETFSFTLALTSEGPAPWLGTAWIAGTLAPFYDSPTTGDVAPRFTGKLTDVRAFTIADAVRTPAISIVSAASFSGVIAPDSVATVFGTDLSAAAETARSGLALSIGETAVEIIDFAGTKRRALLFSVAPNQINFIVDPATRPGPAVVSVTRGTRLVATGSAEIERVAPALFSADRQGTGAALGELLRIGSGSDQSLPLATYDEVTRKWLANTIDLGEQGDLVYVVLYGTGIRNRADARNIRVLVDGSAVPVLSANPSHEMPGLDQVTIGPLPASLRGKGVVEASIDIDRRLSNRVVLDFQ